MTQACSGVHGAFPSTGGRLAEDVPVTQGLETGWATTRLTAGEGKPVNVGEPDRLLQAPRPGLGAAGFFPDPTPEGKPPPAPEGGLSRVQGGGRSCCRWDGARVPLRASGLS